MNQTKIGRFIAEERKNKNYTQRELAEILGISDKTISKWECGKGFPEVSLLLPLCKELGITVNELLSGERVAEGDYKRKSEEIIMDLVREKEENKKKVLLAVACALVTLLASLTIIFVAEFVPMEIWLQYLLTGIGIVVLLSGLLLSAALEWNAGTFECKHCKTRFIPTYKAYLAGAHTLTTRHLQCPECGQKSMCKRRLTH